MSAPAAWKLALTGGMGIAAGAALLSVDWAPSQLAAFAGFALLARGALHVVTSAPFVGFGGAFAALAVAGDVGVGIAALAWPDPTLATLSLLLGTWAVVRAIAGGTIAVTTRAHSRQWLLFFAFAIGAATLGAILVASRDGTVREAAVLIGLLALLEGTREVSEAAFRARGERHRRARAVASATPS
jgi:hypothetical protein